MATTGDWSELLPDVLRSIFERLSFTEFLRVRVVCSAWRSVSNCCLPKQDPFPWLIVVEHNNTPSSCLLFSPEEEKVYRIRDANHDFAESDVLANFGSWFLLLNQQTNLFVLNLLTREKIHLPPIESLECPLDIQRTDDNLIWVTHLDSSPQCVNIFAFNMKAVLCVDEETKDYLVVWTMKQFCLAFCRKGDVRWREILTFKSLFDESGCRDIAYKNEKLYMYNYNDEIRIFDFSKDFPVEITKALNIPPLVIDPDTGDQDYIAVTNSGDVLVIKRILTAPDETWRFHVFKIKINEEDPQWALMSSLSNEALILDQRISLPAKGIRGIEENSIYFGSNSTYNLFRTSSNRQGDMGVFNLRFRTIKRYEQYVSSCGSSKDALWFFPGRGDK